VSLSHRVSRYTVSLTLQHTMNNTKEKEASIYEIGYLIVSSIPEEKISDEAEAIKKVITDAGATILTDEAPVHQQLAYEMRRKTVSGGYDTYDAAYFGWVKFEVGSDVVESIKKTLEIHPSILRMLLMTTVRDTTYLGKRAAAALAKADLIPSEKLDDKKDAAPATVEEMDKSIDNMVKEA